MGFTAVFQEVEEGFIAFVEEVPGANTQAATIEEARKNLHEAVELVLEANRELARESVGAAKVIREPFKITGSAAICFATWKRMAARYCARAADIPSTSIARIERFRPYRGIARSTNISRARSVEI